MSHGSLHVAFLTLKTMLHLVFSNNKLALVTNSPDCIPVFAHIASFHHQCRMGLSIVTYFIMGSKATASNVARIGDGHVFIRK